MMMADGFPVGVICEAMIRGRENGVQFALGLYRVRVVTSAAREHAREIAFDPETLKELESTTPPTSVYGQDCELLESVCKDGMVLLPAGVHLYIRLNELRPIDTFSLGLDA